MIFHEHKEIRDRHAFLGGSNYHWLRYSPDKLLAVYSNFKATERGTELHKFAADAIRLKIRLSNSKKTLNRYVNDAIGFGMTPEVSLKYSDNCFGCADAICFDDNFLRIHDLKTGKSSSSMDQLKIYAAIFCLEYNFNPDKINIELRIYQSDNVFVYIPEKGEIKSITNIIVQFDKILESQYGKDGPK